VQRATPRPWACALHNRWPATLNVIVRPISALPALVRVALTTPSPRPARQLRSATCGAAFELVDAFAAGVIVTSSLASALPREPSRHPVACFTQMVMSVGFGPLYPAGGDSDSVSVQRAGESVATSVNCPVR